MVEGSQAQLLCSAEGVPQPSLSWEKEGVPLSQTTGEYTLLPSGELVLDAAQVGWRSTRPRSPSFLLVQLVSGSLALTLHPTCRPSEVLHM